MFAVINGLASYCISHNNHVVKCLLDMLECSLVDSDLFFFILFSHLTSCVFLSSSVFNPNIMEHV